MGEELVHRTNRRYARQSRGQGSGVGGGVQWSLIAAVLVLLLLTARDWSFAGLGWAELFLLPCLTVLCVWPGVQWYRRGTNWLPLGEAFVAMHLFYYVLPCLEGRAGWLEVSEQYRFLTLTGVGVFLAAFLAVYRISVPKRRPASQTIGFMHREVKAGIVWGMFGLWLVWNVITESRWLPNVGNLLNVFRSAATAAGSMAVIYLFYQSGRKRLPPSSRFLLFAAFAVGLAFSFASGFLIGGAEIMGAALLAFSLGRRRIPAVAMLLSLAVLTVLQLGKGEYRTKYWEEGANYSSRSIGLVKGYATWLEAAWHGLTRANQGDNEQQGFLERTSLAQVLAQVMEATPTRLPFLFGETYQMLPELLVPRVFWPEKPRGTLPTETLAIYYGIQTEQSVDYTGISVGPLVEGWANFGWFGLLGAGAFLGVLFGLPARLSRELKPNQAGWLLASIFLIYSIDLEHSITEILSSLLTALLMGAVLLALISREIVLERGVRRRMNPAMVEADTGER